jgi:hypothetical protein
MTEKLISREEVIKRIVEYYLNTFPGDTLANEYNSIFEDEIRYAGDDIFYFNEKE